MPDIMSIISAALPLVLIGLITWMFLRTRRPRKPKAVKDDHHTRQERAVWSWATIVAAKQGTVDAGGRARVVLELEVHTPGSPPYNAKTTWMVEQESLGYVQTGKEIPLKVDPLDPKYVYPNAPWAKYAE